MKRLPAYVLLALLAAVAGVRAEGRAALEAVVRITASIPPEARTAGSLGTERTGNGILIDRDGHVLTIGYLILEARRIEVTTSEGKTFPARFAGYDHDTGFGLLQTTPPLPGAPLALGDASEVAVGDPVEILTAGELAGLGAHVVSREPYVGYWEYLLDSAIYAYPPHPDYGGAALVTADGRLVGVGSILTRVTLAGEVLVPCNMFVPIDLLKPILVDLIQQGESREPPRPWLGLHSEEFQGRVVVMRVSEEGPAAAAGLEAGDLILSVGGQAVSGLADFYRKLWSMGQAGAAVKLRVLQGDRIREIEVASRNRRDYLRPAAVLTGNPV